MDAASAVDALRKLQSILYIIIALELTGYMFPPPAALKPKDKFDYIIIGGGTAGSVIATRLAQHEYNVLLIERGQDAPFESTYPGLMTYMKYSQGDWNLTSENDNYSYQCHVHKRVDLSQGQMLGGTNAMNYMIYSRGNSQNFDEWAWIARDSNWAWINVLPYFIKAEAVYDDAIMKSSSKYFFGSKGYMGVTRVTKPITDEFLEGFKQVGNDLIDDIDGNRNGYSKGLTLIANGTRQEAGAQYLSQVTDSKYLLVAKGTLATKILFDEYNNAIGVDIITDEGKKIVVYARQEIIISAGAFKSPQLLMLSGIGPKSNLEKLNINCISDLPVGTNLQDHIGVMIPHKSNKKAVQEDVDPGEYPTALFVGYGALNKTYTKHDRKFPDYQATGRIINNMEFLLQFCASTLGFSYASCNKLYKEANGNQILVTILSNIFARSRGQVLLRSNNPLDTPKIITDSFSYDRDLDDFTEYVSDYLKVEKSEAFKNLGATMVDLTSPRCDAFEKGSREYWRCYTLCMMVSVGSYGGTCAMGSVVDGSLRVYGVNRLRVADASIMPKIATGSLSQTVVMIGEKAADIIIREAGFYNDLKHEQIKEDQIKNI